MVEEARIDELERVFGYSNLDNYGEEHYYPKRIAELKQLAAGGGKHE
jgi:hypothetical protein